MSWQLFVALVADEVGEESAERIQERARIALGGLRLMIPKRKTLTREQAMTEMRRSSGRVDLAAKRAGVSKATMYRRLRPEPRRQDPGPRMAGRMVR